MPKTWADLKYLIWNMVKGLRPYDSSVKYYVYVYTLMWWFAIHVMYIMTCTGFVFWDWRLSTERVVAQPLHLYLFPPCVKVLGYYWWLPPYILSYDSLKFCVTVNSYIYVLCSFGYSRDVISSYRVVFISCTKCPILHLIRADLYGHVSRLSVRSWSFVN